MAQEISYFSENSIYLSPPVTLKMMSRSPKSKCHISLSQQYIYASLEKIHPLVLKIFYLKDHDLENEVKSPKSNQL